MFLVVAKMIQRIPQMTFPNTAMKRLPFFAAIILKMIAAATPIHPPRPAMVLHKFTNPSPHPLNEANAAGYQFKVSVDNTAAI